jgi:hypothetical protein
MKRESKPSISPVEFIERVIKLNEKGLPWELSPYQRRVLELAFRRGVNCALAYRVRRIMKASERSCVPSSFSAFTVTSGYRQKIGSLILAPMTAVSSITCSRIQAVRCLSVSTRASSATVRPLSSIPRLTTALCLADHKIWKPTAGQPINLESSVEFYFRHIYGEFPRAEIVKVLVDPYQMQRSIQTLVAAGLPVEEYNQTQGNLPKPPRRFTVPSSIAICGSTMRPICASIA